MSRKTADTYTASVTRLKALVAKLESAQVDVDELESVVRESVELVALCRSRLRATQTSVDTLLAGLQDDAESSPIQTAAPPLTVGASPTAAHSVAQIKPAAVTVKSSEDYDPFADE